MRKPKKPKLSRVKRQQEAKALRRAEEEAKRTRPRNKGRARTLGDAMTVGHTMGMAAALALVGIIRRT